MSGFKIGFAIFTAMGLLAVSAPARAQPPSPNIITVQLSEYRFSPMEIDLNRGQAYVLRVVNSGGKAHDLSAKAFFQTVSLGADSAAEVKDGAVELAMGESTDVALTPNQPGTYEMHCTHPLHAMLGMKGKIVVR
jgi:plastocyanin